MSTKKKSVLSESTPAYGAVRSIDARRSSKTDLHPAPFEWDSPLLWPEKVEMALACLILLPVLRFLATVFFAGAGALWCILVYTAFRPFGPDPRKHPSMARRVRVSLLRYPCMIIQRLWLFALGFWWINVEGHDVVCGIWCGKPTKVIVANHTSFIDMLIMVWQHNPSFLGKRAILKIPLIGTVGFVNEMIAVDRENIVVAGTTKTAASSNANGSNNNPGSATTKDKIVAHILDPNAPPLLVFPEGTTCRNDCLLQFKAGGAFQTAHGAKPVQPMLLTFNNKKWLPWRDTFDYANTPATNNKLWALRFFCRFRHSLTVTYLPPVDPHDVPSAAGVDDAAEAAADGVASSAAANTSTMSPMTFANATRDALAAAMGPSAHVTEQSYEEFFLFKEGCEKLKLPGHALRSLDYKRARDAVAVAQTGSQSESGSKPLTLEGAKATLRAYGACRQAQRESQPLSDEKPIEGVTTTGLMRTLLAPSGSYSTTVTAAGSGSRNGSNGSSTSGSLGQDATALSEASELWLGLAAEAASVDAGGRVVLLLEGKGSNANEVSSQPLYGSSFSAEDLKAAPDAALDFQAFLVGLHKKRPHAALAAGWLDNFGSTTNSSNGGDSAIAAQVSLNIVSDSGRANGDKSAVLVSPEGRKRPRTRAAATAEAKA